MVRTWSTGEGNDETCDNCGSVYAVTIHHLPTKDRDSFRCQVCRELLREWNSTSSPSFELKHRGTPPEGNN